MRNRCHRGLIIGAAVWLAGAGCQRLGFGRSDEELSPCDPECAPDAERLALSVAFATPNAIALTWDAAGLGPDVDGYPLRYGTDEAALTKVRSSAGCASFVGGSAS